jgi:hypothetical protein
MNAWIKFKSLFQPAAAEVLAAQEYDEARRALLEAHSAREYADAMVTYHTKRIERLKATMAGEGV